MPEICFYEPWTYQLALPEKFEQILEETKKKRISYEADHCSQYNTRTQGKSAKLHPPTLSAVLKLIAMQEQKEPEAGAAGIQNVENSIRYFCMEYPLDEEVCVMTYNFRNGRFCGIRKKKDPDGGDTTKMPGVLKGGSTGEEYLAMLAFASIVSKSRYYDDEFHACYEELKRALKKGLVQLVPKMSLLCCDNLYQRVTAGTKDTIPFDCNQFFNGKLKDSFLPFDLNSGIYAPNACIIGSFKVLGAQKGKNNATIAELKVAYKGCFTCPSVEAERIPMLPENYIASQEVEEILEMVTHTPARLFMMTGEAGTGKTTDARMLAQILGLPYYVFTCGPGTVYFHSCAEFAEDRNDRLRITTMETCGSNRDGAALLFVANKLLNRPEKHKMLFLISDGLPNATCYSGSYAMADLRKIKEKLVKKGIVFQAAAIGWDKKAIQEIYGNAYLDISDLGELPVRLTKQLAKLLRRAN